MGDISTNKHYSDDAVKGWREGRRGMKEEEGERGDWGERLTGEKKSVLLCVRDCVVWIYVVIITFLFVLIGTILPMKTLYYHRHS